MLTSPEIALLVVIGAALVLILSNRVRPDVVAILVLLSLSALRLVTPQEALAGFSSAAIITIIGLFIVTRGLEETGVVNWLAERLRKLGANRERRLILIFMSAGATLSLVMNNIAAGAVLLPAAVRVGRDSGVPPSRLLIPLAFGTSVGGMATYFTTANIVLSQVLVANGIEGLNMFSFLPTGGLVVVASLIYMATIGRRLLPVRESMAQGAGIIVNPTRTLYETYELEDRLWELRILPSSRLVDVSLRTSQIGSTLGLTVLSIWRGHEAILAPSSDEIIHSGDYLLVLGREDRVIQMRDWGIAIGRNDSDTGFRRDYAVDLTEVVIPPRSSIIGKTLFDLRFRNKYGLTSVALWRGGRSYRTDVGKFALQVGDALLMVGTTAQIRSLAQERDFMVVQSGHNARPPAPEKAKWAVPIAVIVLLLSIFEIIPTPEAMLAGAVAMVLAGCLNMDEAYRAVEWRVVFLIAGMLPISLALAHTGLAERIGGLLVSTFVPYGALALIAGLFLVTVGLTQVIAGQVAAVVLGPIAVETAIQVGVDPRAVAVAVAIACSTAFLTPISHAVNVLMMGPGGYVPSDFPRVGFGMAVITFVMVLIGMVVFWGIGFGTS